MTLSTRAPRGFTLVELVIAVAIVGILAAIALPSYSSYVRRGNRTVAKAFMSELLQREEAYAVDHKSYTSSLSNLGYTAGIYLGSDGNLKSSATGTIYKIELFDGSGGSTCPATVAVGTTTQLVAVVATPVSPGPQATDTCMTLCLTSAGIKTVGGGATATVDDCWSK